MKGTVSNLREEWKSASGPDVPNLEKQKVYEIKLDGGEYLYDLRSEWLEVINVNAPHVEDDPS